MPPPTPAERPLLVLVKQFRSKCLPAMATSPNENFKRAVK